jgi:hypothetical protein
VEQAEANEAVKAEEEKLTEKIAESERPTDEVNEEEKPAVVEQIAEANE